MKHTNFHLSIFIAFILAACAGETSTSEAEDTATLSVQNMEADYGNPAAPGFNLADSDARAIELADSVVIAYGGRRAYDQNRYFKWNFFGVRELTWDKQEQRVRIDFPSKKAVYLLDIEAMTGRAMIDGTEITNPDSLAVALGEAKSIWINDSYWLIHQFKLKDSGVTLKYVDDTPVDPENARPSYVIDQTFASVGDTPGNRYRLYIDKESHKINTWQFYREAGNEEANMQTPWNGESEFNGIILSSDRGGRFQLQDISTPKRLKADLFTDF
ncbi:hypothetical protein CEQ90_05500 [Lewinellaceae bacterium SD302]|nr:hypothetical protein CEQ90_05500 [Lewinellaceae bacterium SD302]